MIYEIKEQDFNIIKNLLTNDRINIEIIGVMQGYNPGCIYVDNLDLPTTAMIWSKAIGGFYFIGDEDNAGFNDNINEYIDGVIAPRAKELGLNSFEFSGTSLEWDATIERIFEHRKLSKSVQLTYKYDLDKQAKTIAPPGGFHMLRIDEKLLNGETTNVQFARDMILDWWESIEKFLEHAIGYCIVKDSAIVSCCVTSCLTDNCIGSHTVTDEKYRGMGLGKILINQYLIYSKEKNLTPNWDCMDTNHGSKALAKATGFRKAYDYNLYWFRFE